MSKPLRTHVLDVGHGDTIILELPDTSGKKVIGVIDCCDADETWAVMSKEKKPDLIHFMVASHPHFDHIKGFEALLKKCKSENVEARMFWDSGYPHTSQTYEDLIDYLEDENIPTWHPRAGLSAMFGDVEVHVLAPPDPLLEGTAQDCNNASIVLLVKYKQARLLFAGDAQFSNWAHSNIEQQSWMRAGVLKVAHHGSKHGTFLEVLEAVNPDHAIISCRGQPTDDDPDFPHTLTTEALEEFGCEVFYTSVNEDILIESKANGHHDVIPKKK
jgi:beta-lactamase superfamily II metal-dependent hydrolase